MMMQLLSIQLFKIGILVIKMEKVEFIILLLKEGIVLERIHVYPGHKLKQDLLSHGNIQAAF